MLGLGLLCWGSLRAGAPGRPFAARHFPYEPEPPLLTAPDYLDVLRGATITLSNFGMIAGKYAAPIVLPPTVAILGAGRIRREVVANGDAPAIHRIVPLSLTFDHRVVSGGEAGRFLAAVIADLALAE